MKVIKASALINMLLTSTIIFSLVGSGAILSSDRENAKYPVVGEIIALRERASDQVALYNAQGVQRDFDYQLALAKADIGLSEVEASGCWDIDFYHYCYTAHQGWVPDLSSGTLSKSLIAK